MTSTTQSATIQQVARQTGLSEPTLRYYEQIGLIPAVDRDPGSGHLAARLLRDDYRVRVTVRSATKADEVCDLVKRTGADPDGRLEVVTATLDDDSGWDDALKGVTFAHHVASPFPPAQPGSDEEVIAPARDGALRVLRAARDAGTARVILTSSFAAVGYTPKDSNAYDETDWTDPDGDNPAYIRSKAIAERAAWDFVENQARDLELTVVNPTGIFGPVLGERLSSSVLLIKMALAGELPSLPRASFGVADVRDVAEAHVRAMLEPRAAGQRFLAYSGEVITWKKVSDILREGLGEQASGVPVKEEGPEPKPAPVISNAKAREMLGLRFRPAAETIIETARSLAALGLV